MPKSLTHWRRLDASFQSDVEDPPKAVVGAPGEKKSLWHGDWTSPAISDPSTVYCACIGLHHALSACTRPVGISPPLNSTNSKFLTRETSFVKEYSHIDRRYISMRGFRCGTSLSPRLFTRQTPGVGVQKRRKLATQSSPTIGVVAHDRKTLLWNSRMLHHGQ